MKHISNLFLFLFIMSFAYMLSACSESNNDEDLKKPSDTQQPSEPETPDEPSSNDLIVPCDAKATEQTKKLYTFLHTIYGKKCLSATMANVNWNTDEAEHVYQLTGQYPAINCFDFIHIQNSPSNWIDYTDITPVVNWHSKGGIVSLMWHFMVPTNSNSSDYTYNPSETTFKCSEIFKQGTWEHTYFYTQLDKVCATLLKLQDAGIAALWRPLHEAAGNIPTNGAAWFWWGNEGAETYVKLWKLMFDYMQQKEIHNLIWIWTSQNNGDNNWYPGNKYVDVIGRDLYGLNATNSYNQWKQLTESYTDKPIALTECGNLLNNNQIQSQQATIGEQWSSRGARWLFFMPWYDYDFNTGVSSVNKMCNDDFWENAMTRDYVLTRNDLKELI